MFKLSSFSKKTTSNAHVSAYLASNRAVLGAKIQTLLFFLWNLVTVVNDESYPPNQKRLRICKVTSSSYSPTYTQKSRSAPNIKRPITISNKASRPAATTTNDWFPSFEEDDDRRFFLDDEVCVQLQMLLPTYLHSSSLIKDMSDWSYLLQHFNYMQYRPEMYILW